MNTINLERELLKENRSILISKELLYLKEYDRIGVDNSNVLNRVGIDFSFEKGKQMHKLIQDTIKFKGDKVFHIKQIEKIAKRYGLRFLKAKMYHGNVDEHLPSEISKFEISYDVECNKDNCFIMAPAESFRLQSRPKDPLFFYKVNSDYYVLIYKWGNDLSLSNYIQANIRLTILPIFLIVVSVLHIFIFKSLDGLSNLIIIAGMLLFCFMCITWDYDLKDKWNSDFK